VESQGPGQQRLMGAPLAGFLAYVSWYPGEGWRLYVHSWHEGQLPTSGLQTTYTHLTVDELADVLSAEQYSRCEWLRP